MVILASIGRTGSEDSRIGWLIIAFGFVLTVIALAYCHRADVPGRGRVCLVSVILVVTMIAYVVYCISQL